MHVSVNSIGLLRELSFLSGGGASVCGGPEFFGVVKGGPFFSVGQGGPESFEGQRGGDQNFFLRLAQFLLKCII